MSDTTASLRRKIGGANDLQSVVRTMKAVAAASIGQYEQSVAALNDYYRTVELGLGVCFRNIGAAPLPAVPNEQTVAGTIGTGTIGAIVFGSDQGLVGQFNDLVADHAVETLATLPAKRPAKSPAKPPAKPVVWAVGGRVQARLTDAGLSVIEVFAVPSSIKATTPLIGQILVASETGQPGQGEVSELHLFYNRPTSGAGYAPAARTALADGQSTRGHGGRCYGGGATLRTLIREYLFVSLFRACAESLASENASRLAAMQRADKNIDELLEELNGTFHRLRQSSIDEELFDVIAGFEALMPKGK